MKLVNGFDLMEFAKKHHHVLPAFNTTNLEMTIAIAKGLMDAKLPGYIQISSNNLKLSNPRIIALMAMDAVKIQKLPSDSIWITVNPLKTSRHAWMQDLPPS